MNRLSGKYILEWRLDLSFIQGRRERRGEIYWAECRVEEGCGKWYGTWKQSGTGAKTGE